MVFDDIFLSMLPFFSKVSFSTCSPSFGKGGEDGKAFYMLAEWGNTVVPT